LGKNRSNGFTLLELIVVLVIVGLMAGLVLPRLLGSFTTIELKSAVRETAMLLRQTRDTAYFKKKYMKASLDIDANSITIFRYQQKQKEETQESYLSPGMEWIWITDLSFPKNVTIAKCMNREEEFDEGKFEILFFPDGNSSGGKILLKNHRSRQFLIGVDFITGTVRTVE